jgi:hypothetical protein
MRNAIRRNAQCLRKPNAAAERSTVVPIADATALNQLEDLLRTADPSSDCCQEGEKAKDNKTCVGSLE